MPCTVTRLAWPVIRNPLPAMVPLRSLRAVNEIRWPTRNRLPLRAKREAGVCTRTTRPAFCATTSTCAFTSALTTMPLWRAAAAVPGAASAATATRTESFFTGRSFRGGSTPRSGGDRENLTTSPQRSPLRGTSGLAETDSRVEPTERRRRPPVPASQELHQRRDEESADDRRVDENGGGGAEPELLGDDDLRGEEGAERDGKEQRCGC